MKLRKQLLAITVLVVWSTIGGNAYAQGLFGTIGEAIDSTLKGVGELVSNPSSEEKKTQKNSKNEQATSSQKTKRLEKKETPEKKKIEQYAFTIHTDPNDAAIKILNIGPKYKDGILLEKGKYHVEIQRSGYKTYQQWIQLIEDKTLSVKLEKLIDNTEKYIRFVQKTKYAIPALPIDALKTKEFREFLIGSIFSSKTLIGDELEKMDSDFQKMKFENNFEKRRAQKEVEKQKQELIQKTAEKYEKINIPVFYADFYTPIDDKNDSVYFDHMELVDWEGKRRFFNVDTMYRGNDLVFLHKGVGGYLSVCASNESPKTIIRLSMDEKEKLYLNSPKYSGSGKKQVKNRELKGRMFYSISDKTGNYIKLYPEFFELDAYKGRYQSWKAWHRKDRDYGDRESYSLISDEIGN